MSNILLKYMIERYEQKKGNVFHSDPGPVVTISSECGCSGKNLAKILLKEINKTYEKRDISKHWKCISKEILSESARELNLHPSKIKHVFDHKQKSQIDEILAALSDRYYISDKKIRKTIFEVIRSFAYSGNVFIVGRGGVVITRDIPRSLHIKLMAPLEWRVQKIMKKMELSEEKAKEFVLDIDERRADFKNFYAGKTLTDSIFDLIFNYKTTTDQEIAAVVLGIMHNRGFF